MRNTILRNTITWKLSDQSCKLAHTQAIGWALWCLWTAISLVSAYAFFLGIATPLISYKRISTRINLTRVDNSAIIPLRSTSHTVQSSSFLTHSQVSTRGIAKIFVIYQFFRILPTESIAFIFSKLKTRHVNIFLYPVCKCILINIATFTYLYVCLTTRCDKSNLRVLTLCFCNVHLFAIPLKPSLIEQYFID